MSQKINIVVADDHPLLRGGVVLSLEEHGHFHVCAQAGTAEEAISAVDKHLPEIVLLDISMPGSGLTAAAEIAQRYPSVRIVMLTVSEDDDDLLTALKIGARGYVLKGVSAQDLGDVLQSIADGASYVSPTLAARVLAAMQARSSSPDPHDSFEDLTSREVAILKLLATGKSNKEIARDLDLQEKTVKHYMTSILQKLQVRNRVEAALRARELGY